MKDYKIAIGLTTTGTFKSQMVFDLLAMLKDFPYHYEIIMQEGAVLHHNREVIVKTAISYGCTHLLFIDSDMSFGTDALTRLIQRNKDIIGVNAHKKQLPLVSVVKTQNKGEFVTCDYLGTGFLLIKLSVFEKLSHPWFFWSSDDKGDVILSEDTWFCQKARKAGFEIWVDFTLPIKHIGDYAY
jgi:hypothetical protein